MARLAEGLQVGEQPEETLVAAVRFAMVGDQARGVGRREAAARPLTCVEVPGEHEHAQRTPACRLVPLVPGLEEAAIGVSAALDGGQGAHRRLQLGERAAHRLQFHAEARSMVTGCHGASCAGRS